MALKTIADLLARIIPHRGGSTLDAAKTLDAPTFDLITRIAGLLATDNINGSFIARGVVTANIADLTAFDTAGASNDGIIDYSEGQIVFPAAQTVKAQNGPYVVGAVNEGGLAPLTRPLWWTSASSQFIGNECRMSGGGTIFANTVWAAMGVNANPSAVVDTEDFGWWPRSVTRDATLVAGKTAAITNLPVRNASSKIEVQRKTPNTTANSIQYAVDSATRTNGALGSSVSFIVQAEIAAGSINVADVSGVQYTVVNQP